MAKEQPTRDPQVREILNRHAEYMDGYDRGQISFGVQAVIAMIQDALSRTAPAPEGEDVEPLERWADIQDDTDAIVKCGERWKAVAQSIGCQLHGFDDGRHASFTTPDGNVIEVGPKFRASLAALQSPEQIRAEERERCAKVAEGEARDCKTGTLEHSVAWEIVTAIRSLKDPEAGDA